MWQVFRIRIEERRLTMEATKVTDEVNDVEEEGSEGGVGHKKFLVVQIECGNGMRAMPIRGKGLRRRNPKEAGCLSVTCIFVKWGFVKEHELM